MSKSDKNYILGTFLICLALLMFCIAQCHAQHYTFNYRVEQKGSYIFDIDGHSLFVHERYVYEQDGEKKLWQNDWDETILTNNYYQDRIEITTESALWIFWYCENTKQQVCELQYHPKVGEMLTYQKRLK